MKVFKRVVPTVLATAMACAAHADNSRASLFNCVFQPGGTPKIQKTTSLRKATGKTVSSRAFKQIQESDLALSAPKWTALDTVGRHQEPPALTIAKIECRW